MFLLVPQLVPAQRVSLFDDNVPFIAQDMLAFPLMVPCLIWFRCSSCVLIMGCVCYLNCFCCSYWSPMMRWFSMPKLIHCLNMFRCSRFSLLRVLVDSYKTHNSFSRLTITHPAQKPLQLAPCMLCMHKPLYSKRTANQSSRTYVNGWR